ncbi:hypothetical protein, partial [Bacteroides heparinolyticus]|uniref:hypothetical protein n=1 Tax=Prevotella heparinolytica TaxID=28113 RepID=UPI0035A012D2
HLRLTAQTLVSVGLDTCLCRDKGLQLSKQGEGGRPERFSSLLPDRHEPVHSRNIRPTGGRPSPSAKGTACPELRQ